MSTLNESINRRHAIALGGGAASGHNQETDEHPHLYFSHNIAKGVAIDLAKKVSKVLDKMNLKRTS